MIWGIFFVGSQLSYNHGFKLQFAIAIFTTTSRYIMLVCFYTKNTKKEFTFAIEVTNFYRTENLMKLVKSEINILK